MKKTNSIKSVLGSVVLVSGLSATLFWDAYESKALEVVAVEKSTTFKSSFKDIEEVFSKDDIIFLESRGIVQGTGDGKFNPNGTVTRAQMATMLNRAFNLEAYDFPYYLSDVNPSDWYYNDVMALYGSEITGIYEDGKFNPNDKVTRSDATGWIAGALQRKSKMEITYKPHSFNDVKTWNYEGVSVSMLVELGIISGKTATTFDPEGYLTRAQMAKVLAKAIKVAEENPL